MPLFFTSSAISRPGNFLIGRPAFIGASHAKTAIWQRCSAVILAGAPGRRASCNREARLSISRSVTGQILKLCEELQESKEAKPVVTLFQHVLISLMDHPLLSEGRVEQAEDSDRD